MLDRKIIDDYLDYMGAIRGKSQNTITNYKIDLKLLFNYLDSTQIKSIQDVKLQDLHDFIKFCENRGDAKTTRARRVASIKSFFRYLCRIMKLIEVNPASELETPKIEEKNPHYLTLKQSKKLLKSIDGKYKKRDYAIITLFLNCGMRLTELTSIDIDKIKGDTLVIVGKGDKERTIYLNDVCISALENYMKVRPNFNTKALFVSERKQRISYRTVQETVKKYLNKAGLDTNTLSTHSLRHTSATLMYKYGKVDIRTLQEILGHKSIATTEIYTHVDDEQLREAVKANPLNIK